MRGNLRDVAWRLALAWSVCLALVFGLIAVFGDIRFQPQKTFSAEFTNVSGLKDGDFVRVAGVEVGKVHEIAVNDDASVRVDFSTDISVVLTEATRALVRYENLVGDRYLALEQGPGSNKLLKPGQVIPTSRTAPALDVDAVIGGLHPLLRALDPTQVNALTGQLIQVFQGQGDLIGSFLDQTAALTGTLAARDHLIGEVIT